MWKAEMVLGRFGLDTIGVYGRYAWRIVEK